MYYESAVPSPQEWGLTNVACLKYDDAVNYHTIIIAGNITANLWRGIMCYNAHNLK